MPWRAAGGQLRREPAWGGGLFGGVPRCSLRRLRGEGWSRRGGGEAASLSCLRGPGRGAVGAGPRGPRRFGGRAAIGPLFTAARGVGGRGARLWRGRWEPARGGSRSAGLGPECPWPRCRGDGDNPRLPPPAHAGPGTIAGTSPFAVSWPHTPSNGGVRGGGCPASAPASRGAGSGHPVHPWCSGTQAFVSAGRDCLPQRSSPTTSCPAGSRRGRTSPKQGGGEPERRAERALRWGEGRGRSRREAGSESCTARRGEGRDYSGMRAAGQPGIGERRSPLGSAAGSAFSELVQQPGTGRSRRL